MFYTPVLRTIVLLRKSFIRQTDMTRTNPIHFEHLLIVILNLRVMMTSHMILVSPSTGKTSKPLSESWKKPWIKKYIVNPKTKTRKVLEKETRSRLCSRFPERSKKKLPQTVSLATRNHNTFMPAKILKRPSIHVRSDV